MKVAIVSNVDIKHMSLISIYTKFFDKHNISFDIINASNEASTTFKDGSDIYTYEHLKGRKNSRIINYINNLFYKRFVSKLLKKNEYDFIIIWRSEVGFLLKKLLINKYREKYILNIRDYAGEKIRRKFVSQQKLTKNSRLNVISSTGFLSFLPKANYLFKDSLNHDISEEIKSISASKNATSPLHLGFIGNIRFFETDIKLLNSLKNDSRFIIQFFGTGSDILKDYATKNGIKNVEFIGPFNIEDTPVLLEKIDIINNIFGDNSISVNTLTSIRYYHSLLAKKPFITNTGTHMGLLTEENSLGFQFDGNYENLGDNLYSWYSGLNFEKYSEKADRKLEAVDKNNKEFYIKLLEVFQ